jgi:hypothetical protein
LEISKRVERKWFVKCVASDGRSARLFSRTGPGAVYIPDSVRSTCHIGYWWESQKERDHWDGVDWIEMAYDEDQWRALVNTVLKIGVP